MTVDDAPESNLDIAQIARDEIAATPELGKLANDGPKFVGWYLHRVHGVDVLAAVDALTDGPGDKQVDAVFIDDEEARVLVVQGKFWANATLSGEAVGECLRAVAGLKDLHALQGAANPKLAVKIPDIQLALSQDYALAVELVTIGDIAPNARRDIHTHQQSLSDDSFSVEIVPVDGKALAERYCMATQRALPHIDHEFDLGRAQWAEWQVNDTRCLLVVMPITVAITVPGIDDQMLFRKNVRQALGKGTKVNKGLRTTLRSDEVGDFFFYHNGITAICQEFKLDPERRRLHVHGVNVVNGCQSLTTLRQNSEVVRDHDTGYLLWRFYEISEHQRADKISTFTNSQNAVSSRDLASNDTVQLLLKRRIEGRFPAIHFATKRGAVAPPGKELLDAAVFAKLSISWDHWMPYRAHSEQALFDRYYTRLFHSQLDPDDVVPVFELFGRLKQQWEVDGLGIRDELRAKSYHTPYHVLTAVALLLSAANPASRGMPLGRALRQERLQPHLDRMLRLSARCVQRAFEKAAKAAEEQHGFLAIENWLKSKDAVQGAQEFAKTQMDVLEDSDPLVEALRLPPELFREPAKDDD